jgi:hypothetical protein
MTDDRLPIVFRRSMLSTLAMFVITGVFAMAAVWRALDDRPGSAHIGPFEISVQTQAWVVALVLGAVSLFALAMLVLRCPRLTLTEKGIVVARCFHAPVNIPWSALAAITVRTMRRQGKIRAEVVDVIYLVTRDGTEIGPGPLGKAKDIEPVIRRVAARMGSVLRADYP